MGHKDLKTSLQYLTEKYLHVTISKGGVTELQWWLDPKMRCGNWGLEELSDEQILYAAGDSYYSREVFVYFYNLYCSRVKDEPLSALEWCLSNHMEVIPSRFASRIEINHGLVPARTTPCSCH